MKDKKENILAENDSGPDRIDTLSQKEKLMIVEDNPAARRFIQFLFSKTYNVITASDGQEGIDLAIKESPDIIICDVNMPVKNGFDCCKEIKSNPLTCHIPIIMLTAYDDTPSIIQGTESGADDYLTKPTNPEILVSKVKNILKTRQELQKTYMRQLLIPAYQESLDSPIQDSLVQKAIEIIKKHIDDANFNVNKLADLLNVCAATLYRRVKQNTNLTSIELIRCVRMKNAAELISQQNYTIQEISEMVGYLDIPTFRKHFTNFFGQTPSAYKNSLQQAETNKFQAD